MENNDKYITIIEDDGKENVAEILFTFENDGDNYVLLTLVEELSDVDTMEHEYDVLCYMYEQQEDGSVGKLIEIEENDTKRWEIVSEMFSTFENTNFEVEEE